MTVHVAVDIIWSVSAYELLKEWMVSCYQGRAQGGGPVARATAPLPSSAEVPISPTRDGLGVKNGPGCSLK